MCSKTQLRTLRLPKAVRPRKTAVLIESNQTTALVKGGKLNVISLPVLRIKDCLLVQLRPSYRSGTGTTGKLRCPSLSTARTPKITLSFERSKVASVLFPTDCTCSHSGALVARQTTS